MEKKEKFISVIKEHKKIIFKICSSYCRHIDERKDLEQEILLQLWHSFPKYDGRVKISTWMYKIALYTAISFYRDNEKHKRNHVAIDESVISLPEEQTDQKENIHFLYHCIRQLNELDKALILLYLEEHSYKEIAQIIGITETNVATKLNRIKNHLKEQFNNQ
jgi:RNA polymerase sigma-70 factor (ECF subfamily)